LKFSKSTHDQDVDTRTDEEEEEEEEEEGRDLCPLPAAQKTKWGRAQG
jgi:hypothetical protein